MKKIACLWVICAVAVMGSGCTTTTLYCVDRAFDLADVVTATVGVGLGVKVRAGRARTGLLVRNRELFGLRGGSVFAGEWVFPPSSGGRSSWSFWDNDWYLPPPFAFLFHKDRGLWDTDEEEHWDEGFRNKGIEISSWRGARHLFLADPFSSTDAYYYTQIEAVVGLGLSVRLGFNPGELLDFFLGWFGIDIYKDGPSESRGGA